MFRSSKSWQKNYFKLTVKMEDKMANAIPKQLTKELGVVYKEDHKLTKGEMENLLSNTLDNDIEFINDQKGQKVVKVKYHSKTKDYYIMLCNITSMGGKVGQHPDDLKRIQYNITWRDFYEKYSKIGTVKWGGIYSFDNINILAFFSPETYLMKHQKSNMMSKNGHKANYSCHVFLNDLYHGVGNNVYTKTDKNNNIIQTVSLSNLGNFLQNSTLKTNPIIERINQINHNDIVWNQWIIAKDAIEYMKTLECKDHTKAISFNNWKQNLWNGWYIEAKYSESLRNKPCQYMYYVATTDNNTIRAEYTEYKLDLAFPKQPFHFIGDLKSVSGTTGETLLNDEKHVNKALQQYGKVWFVFYLHDKQPGSTNNFEMVKWRNNFILESGEWKSKTDFNEMSAPQTPHSIRFTEMVIVELNEITKEQFFKIKPQFGLNSNGTIRADKYAIDKRNLHRIFDNDGFVIYRYKPKAQP